MSAHGPAAVQAGTRLVSVLEAVRSVASSTDLSTLHPYLAFQVVALGSDALLARSRLELLMGLEVPEAVVHPGTRVGELAGLAEDLAELIDDVDHETRQALDSIARVIVAARRYDELD